MHETPHFANKAWKQLRSKCVCLYLAVSTLSRHEGERWRITTARLFCSTGGGMAKRGSKRSRFRRSRSMRLLRLE